MQEQRARYNSCLFWGILGGVLGGAGGALLSLTPAAKIASIGTRVLFGLVSGAVAVPTAITIQSKKTKYNIAPVLGGYLAGTTMGYVAIRAIGTVGLSYSTALGLGAMTTVAGGAVFIGGFFV